MHRPLLTAAALTVLCGAAAHAQQGAGDGAPAPDVLAARVQQFERDVRPLLAAHCYACHGPDAARVKGGLRMTGRDALLDGGDSGPALVPGDPEASLIVRAVRYEHPDVQMPPRERLSAREIDALVEWIAGGATWPADAASAPSGSAAAESEPAFEPEHSTWWSFQALARPELPAGAAADAHPIDAFVDARLAAAGIEPNAPAAARELVRRAYIDVLGVPPTLAEIRAYEQDAAPQRWERFVDALLERPEYGERMARRWLDLARFAQTNGYERDTEKPFAWRYRDWVVSAFERDMPYDMFLRAQLAGDELEGPRSANAVGTGLLRIGPWDDEPDDKEQARFDELDDIARVVGEGMLGLTIGCARCHDHKFDPLPQTDYYALVAHVRNLTPYAPPELSMDSTTLAPIGASGLQLRQWYTDREAARAKLVAEREDFLIRARAATAQRDLADLTTDVRAAFAAPAERRTPQQADLVARHASRDFGDTDALDALSTHEHRRAIEVDLELSTPAGIFEGDLNWALVARTSAELEPTHVLARGRASSPGEIVAAAPPRVLAPALGPPSSQAPAGSRSALAEWVTSERNPLTARVWANRLWQYAFGRGIAATPSDFGRMGALPTHPELLDWLASELVAREWSTKALWRLILTSRAYQRSSRAASDAALARDPANELWWRQSELRIDAECVHDGLLRASGELDPERGGRGFFPELSREVLGGASRPGEGWEVSTPQQRARRALYAFAKRGVRPALSDAFDGADSALSIGARASTTTATQALVLLNGDFAAGRARAAANAVLAEVGARRQPEELVTRAYERVLARPPAADERALGVAFLGSQARGHAEQPDVLSFRPRVPSRVNRGYLRVARGADLLYAPTRDFQVVTGVWGAPYNDTLEPELARGPAALWSGAATTSADFDLRAGLRLRAGCEVGSIYLRAHVRDTWIAGLELRFEPRLGRLSLWRVDDAAALLAAAHVSFDIDGVQPLLVELTGSRCRVHLGAVEEPQLDVDDARVRGSGGIGARAVGEALELVDPQLASGGNVHALGAGERRAPLELALESLCLALFNTNEFLYRD